jgi:hypothetical protein
VAFSAVRLCRILLATQLQYKLKPSAQEFYILEYKVWAAGVFYFMPSLVQIGYAIPDPKTFDKIWLSFVNSLHYGSISN